MIRCSAFGFPQAGTEALHELSTFKLLCNQRKRWCSGVGDDCRCVCGWEAELKSEPGCQTLDLWGAPRVLPCTIQDIPIDSDIEKFEETTDDECAIACI